jgi:hypothetical protein
LRVEGSGLCACKADVMRRVHAGVVVCSAMEHVIPGLTGNPVLRRLRATGDRSGRYVWSLDSRFPGNDNRPACTDHDNSDAHPDAAIRVEAQLEQRPIEEMTDEPFSSDIA